MRHGGTTEVAVLSLGGMVVKKSVGIAGDEMDEAIVNYFRRKYNLIIGENTAEDVKMTIGSVYPLEEEMSMNVKGRDQITGLPRTIKINSEEMRIALSEPTKQIIEIIKNTLEETPAELSADLVDCGIVLSGGGSLIRGFDKLLAQETDLPVNRADDPLTCVARGTGIFMEELDNIKHDNKF
ncbi:hypothetical protein ATZ36_13635 [Candidatus Endomicrobiellum trichonymphae]|uniref:Rod shape-determining protein MreB n=1 Tax=Endomicrobium trichonymphae TaxID=1408204 RepID=A0A1E5INC5_ENDTX|nr:hypothetical protein ATZ36_13635 [Candidatus Endomicrobium trichonymphae]